MKIEQVAAQLYTLREFCRTPADIAQTLRRVKEIGYQAVQLSGLGPIEDNELARMLDDSGLVCCATHAPGDRILNEPERVAEQLDKFKCAHVAFPHPGGIDLSKLKNVKELAERLNAAGEKLNKLGKVLSYHNHSVEFRKLSNKPILEIIMKRTNPQFLQSELDTYWVQHGGADPVEWCKKMKGRLPCIHMKDYVINAENQPTYAEIGRGNLMWKKIVKQAEKSGCKWFIVEQDTCPGDPFDSLRISFDYLKANLAA